MSHSIKDQLKVCSKCEVEKPLAEFPRRPGAKDGRRGYCKVCQSAYRQANRSKIAASNKAHYEANRSRIIARNKAYYEANRDEVAAYKKAYREANCAEINAAKRAYRQANPAEVRAAEKAHYEANRHEIIARNKAYGEANREQIAAYRKVRHAEMWANDPEYRARAHAASNRRRRMLADAVSEPYIREDIFERDGWSCGICAEHIDPATKYPDSGSVSIDHVVPVSLGGDDTPANVQAAHLGCNIGRGNRT